MPISPREAAGIANSLKNVMKDIDVCILNTYVFSSKQATRVEVPISGKQYDSEIARECIAMHYNSIGWNVKFTQRKDHFGDYSHHIVLTIR